MILRFDRVVAEKSTNFGLPHADVAPQIFAENDMVQRVQYRASGQREPTFR